MKKQRLYEIISLTFGFLAMILTDEQMNGFADNVLHLTDEEFEELNEQVRKLNEKIDKEMRNNA